MCVRVIVCAYKCKLNLNGPGRIMLILSRTQTRHGGHVHARCNLWASRARDEEGSGLKIAQSGKKNKLYLFHLIHSKFLVALQFFFTMRN